MKSLYAGIWLFAVGVALGLFVGQHRYAGVPATQELPGTAGTERVTESSADSTRDDDSLELAKIYSRLGLRNLDTIVTVNGYKGPEGLLLLASAYQAGRLCVRYEREEETRKVCLTRDSAGEKIVDAAD